MDIPYPDRNMIKADISITGTACTVSGSSKGLGIKLDNIEINNSLIFGCANDNFGFAYGAYRISN